MQREIPTLFNDQMVRAILAPTDPKTETRRPMRPQPADLTEALNARPPARPGDRLWVRECWQIADRSKIEDPVVRLYRADGTPRPAHGWRPSIHMPRWASRISLPVVEVRCERLHDITEEGAKREGFKSAREFEAAFFLLYRPAGEAGRLLTVSEFNPWVWVTRWSQAEVRRG